MVAKTADRPKSSEGSKSTRKTKLQTRQMPKHWLSWSSDKSTICDIGVDDSVTLTGNKAACVEVRKTENNYAQVWLYQTFDASLYQGKRVKLSASVKTKSVVNQSGLSLAVYDGSNRALTRDNMANRPISGTVDWTKHDLVLDVPEHALKITIGAWTKGTGSIWMSQLTLEETGLDISRTDNYTLGCRGIWWTQPLNLDLALDEDVANNIYKGFVGPQPRAWLRWGTEGNFYEAGANSEVVYSGQRSGCVRSLKDVSTDDYVLLSQKFCATAYRGKRVRFSAYVKTADSSYQRGLQMAVMDIDQNNLELQNTFDLDGVEHDWLKRYIVMDVPNFGGVFSIGAHLSGRGALWFDEAKFEIVELDTPLTRSKWNAKPRNLSFEDD